MIAKPQNNKTDKAEPILCQCGAVVKQKPIRICGPCRHKKELKKSAGKKSAWKKAQSAYERSRLPDGSVFQAVYDATKQKWTGWLEIQGTVFTCECSSVFRVMQELDTKYRQAKAIVESQQSPNDTNGGQSTETAPSAA